MLIFLTSFETFDNFAISFGTKKSRKSMRKNGNSNYFGISGFNFNFVFLRIILVFLNFLHGNDEILFTLSLQ